ncbi:hypothetical protein CUMW_267610 [Citrus unshiu]|uniref:Uncharacterized protein n=1 Tax=Citrus unshiu TaxID=55188 RepID=A0A2H5QW82_CITUN|nr:hypothetical protein CUMW_267610 [Citrus unshiu]
MVLCIEDGLTSAVSLRTLTSAPFTQSVSLLCPRTYSLPVGSVASVLKRNCRLLQLNDWKGKGEVVMC